MNIHTAYTIYNNALPTMDKQLAEAIDRIIDDKSKEIDRLQIKNGELNVFLQQRPIGFWGNHVADVAMQYIQKLEAGESNA